MKDEKYIEASKQLMDQLRKAAESKGITIEEIAEKTGYRPFTIDRLFKGKYAPDLDVFIKLCEVIGMKIRIEV